MKVDYWVFYPGSTDPTGQGTKDFPDDGTDPMSEFTNYPVCLDVWLDHAAGNFEHVNVWYRDQYLDMLVGDMSAFDGSPLNKVATEIYWNNMLRHDPKCKNMTHKDAWDAGWPRIHGPAIIFLKKVWF